MVLLLTYLEFSKNDFFEIRLLYYTKKTGKRQIFFHNIHEKRAISKSGPVPVFERFGTASSERFCGGTGRQ
jgi:hypothetical protein